MITSIKEVIEYNKNIIESRKTEKIIRKEIHELSNKLFEDMFVIPSSHRNLWENDYILQPLVLYRKTPKKKK